MERTSELYMEIDERKKTELALKQTQEELIQAAKLAVLGKMSASISHELNNPLAAIRSFAENGKRFIAKGETERTVDNLSRISALTDRMATISQQLKSFAQKTDSDELVVAKVHPIVLSSIDLVMPQVKANQIKLNTHIEETSLQAKVNPIQLEQVLINLLTNAIDELSGPPADDSPDIKQPNMKQIDMKQIDITLQAKNNRLQLFIDDTGRGIDDELVSQLFEPFYTTKKNGLGLGLSISQQIMQTMGGTISVENRPKCGTRFILSINQAQ